MKTLILRASEIGSIYQAVRIIQNNGLVAFPTDTVYGVGCLANSSKAIKQLFTAKIREREKSIPVLLGDMEQLSQIAEVIDPIVQRLAEAFWPGPLTLVVPKKQHLPMELSSSLTIGVRIPDHPIALELIQRCGPLATSSANLSGQPDALTAENVLFQLDGRIDAVVDGGAVLGGVPSTVVDCSGTEIRILREGPIHKTDIYKVVSDISP